MDNHLHRFTRLAAAVARRVAPSPGRFAQPAHAPAAMLATLLLRERPRLTYRGLEDLLRLSGPLRRALGRRDVPDHSTLWWFARRHASPALLDAAPAETVRVVRGGTERADRVAMDSTGFFLAHASWYFARRARRDRGRRGRLKRGFAMWVGPRLPLSQRVRPGPCGDFFDLPPLTDAAARVMPFTQAPADAGYDSEANHRQCRDRLGADSLIPAKKRRSARVRATTTPRREMLRGLGAPGVEADRASYRRRRKAETVMSVVKRRCGDAPSARLEPTRRAQALPRGVAHNVQRPVTLAAAS